MNKQIQDKRLLEESPKAATAKIKKPYAKLSFRYEKILETQALSCSKIGAICSEPMKNS
jgi:hypothetical protein